MAKRSTPSKYRRELEVIFGRPLLSRDGVSETGLLKAERRLDLVLPTAVRDYYVLAGAAKENREHNILYGPDQLVITDGFLIFMEENQAVVHWGLRVPFSEKADPEVWQRVNGDKPEWYPEKTPFSVFIVKNLAWQHGIEMPTSQIGP